MNQSTADRFIDLMAAIKAVQTDDLNDPMRHVMRKCKTTANMALDDAINQAWAFIELAGHARNDCAGALESLHKEHSVGQPDTTESGK